LDKRLTKFAINPTIIFSQRVVQHVKL